MAGLTFGIEVWRASRTNSLLEELTPYVSGGYIEMNVDRAIKRTGNLKIRRPDLLRPYLDYVAPFIVITYDDGSPPLREQVGLFTLRSPKGESSANVAQDEFQLNDLCYELQSSAFSAPFTVAGSQPYTDAVVDVIEDLGITHHAIPSSAATLPGDRTFPEGANRLEVVNEGLQAAGFYAAFSDGQGRIASAPTLSLETVEPSFVLTNADVMGSVNRQPTDRDPVNVVVALKDRSNEAPLISVQRNDDPGSPTSTVSLGREIVRRESVTDIADQAALDAYASRLLAEGRTFYETAQLRLKPTPAVGVHDVIELAFAGEMARHNGRWWIRTWRMGLGIADPTVTMEVNRVTDTWQGLRI